MPGFAPAQGGSSGGNATFANLTVTGVGSFADGSATAPSITVTSAPTHGFYYNASTGELSYSPASAAGRVDIRGGGTGIDFYLSNALGLRTGPNGIFFGASADLALTYHSAANLRQGAAAASDANGTAQTLRSPSGGTVSSGTTGKNGGAYTITAGAGSDAKAGSGANGGNGGILTLTGGAKGLKDGGGSDGLDGGVQVSRSGGLLGFYGTAPIALQTGVAVSAAGVHAALVNLGLITA